MLVQPNADTLAQNLEIISKTFAGIPKFCLWDLQLVAVINVMLLINP